MELNDKQTEFIELLDDASAKVNNFVENIMAPMRPCCITLTQAK